MNLKELDPNLLIVARYSKDNLSLLLAELGSKGLKCDCRPGRDLNTIYVFVSDDSFRVLKIVEKLDFVIKVRPLYKARQQREVDLLFSELVTKKLFLSDNDLVLLAHATENPMVAMYFALARSYTRALMPLAFLGVVLKLFYPLGSEFNVGYSLFVLLWGIFFATSWKYRLEPGYSKLWGYSNSVPGNDSRSTVLKKLLFVPITIIFMILLVAFQLFCFSLEIFLTQIYVGPLKAIVSLLPTILLSIYVPVLTAIHNAFVSKMVKWEDGQNPSRSINEKNFVFSFLTSYMPLLITLFLYFPYGHLLNEQLPLIANYSSNLGIPVDCSTFKINIQRYRSQFFYFTVTNQVVGLFMDNVLPFVLDKIVGKITGEEKSTYAKLKVDKLMRARFPSDRDYLNKVQSFEKSSWGIFSADDNVRKIVLQFGFVVIFSTIWPLAPLIFIAFNIVIFKMDLWRALKKSAPIVSTAVKKDGFEGDGFASITLSPWTSILVFITWFSALITPSLLLMYRETYLPGIGQLMQKPTNWYEHYPFRREFGSIAVVMFLFEHIWVLIYLAVSKLQQSPSSVNLKGFIPAEELKEPPKLNLLNAAADAIQFMNDLNGTSISIAERQPLVDEIEDGEDKVKATGMVVQSEDVMSPVKRAMQTQALSSPSSPIIATKPRQPAPEDVDTPPRQENSASFSSISSAIAGATLPPTIPTSKNYDKRNSTPNIDSASIATLSSVPRISAKSVDSELGKNQKPSENEVKLVVPKSEHKVNIPKSEVKSSLKVGAESINSIEGQQFVPVPSTNQEKDNQFINGSKISATPKKQSAVDTPAKSRRLSLKRDENSLHSNSTKSIKKKTKTLMSPLGKLKKKL